MSSLLVRREIERAGLSELLERRALGLSPDGGAFALAVERAEILALGAAADIARRLECGQEARIYVPLPPPASAHLAVVGAEEGARGTALLRKIAAMRLLGPVGGRIVVEWTAVGLEIAQVALSFGATDIAGPIASRRGLPLVDAPDNQKLYKRREIAGFIERAGFAPVFVETDSPAPIPKGTESRAGAEERS